MLLDYISRSRDDGKAHHQLYWISPEGGVERQERLELQSFISQPESREFWQFSATVPVPAAWVGGMFVNQPFLRLQYNFAHTYGGALRQVFAVGWPMFLIVLAVAVAAAWYTQRLHPRYFRPRPAVWAAFVLVFGPAGLLAYWLEHRRTKLEVCGECGQTVPRDRDACATCETPFPASPVGTEIFA